MADITSPQAVKFTNEKARPFADAYAQLYFAAKTLIAEWNAQSLSGVITNDPADTVIDGSATDGRPIATGEDVTAQVTRAQELVADLEATNNAKLNTILAIAVNTR